MHPRTRHRNLLESIRVQRWYENLSVKSTTTSEVYLRNLGLWLEWIGRDPDSVIDFATSNFDEFKGVVSDRIRIMEKEGKKGSYISVSLKPLLSYLKFHNIIVRLNLNIKDAEENPTVEDQSPPTKDELAKVFRIANPRIRAAVALMAFTGMRPRVIGNREGEDGLKLQDLPELKVADSKAYFEDASKATYIVVRKELSKNHQKYTTFLSTEGITYLIDYLNQRIKNGEKLGPMSPLIGLGPSGKEHKHKHVETVLLLRRIKITIIKAGFNWRPYIFKNYYGANMDMAESKGIIGHSLRQFLMGHKGTITDSYSRRGLTAEQIEEYRSIYSRCEPFLNTVDRGIQENDLTRKLREYTIMMFETNLKIKLDEKKKEELYQLDEDGFKDELRKLSGTANELSGTMNEKRNKQKVVPFNEVEAYIEKGWEYIREFPGNKAIVSLSISTELRT